MFKNKTASYDLIGIKQDERTGEISEKLKSVVQEAAQRLQSKNNLIKIGL